MKYFGSVTKNLWSDSASSIALIDSVSHVRALPQTYIAMMIIIPWLSHGIIEKARYSSITSKLKWAALYEKNKNHKAGLPCYGVCAVFDFMANNSITWKVKSTQLSIKILRKTKLGCLGMGMAPVPLRSVSDLHRCRGPTIISLQNKLRALLW